MIKMNPIQNHHTDFERKKCFFFYIGKSLGKIEISNPKAFYLNALNNF